MVLSRSRYSFEPQSTTLLRPRREHEVIVNDLKDIPFFGEQVVQQAAPREEDSRPSSKRGKENASPVAGGASVPILAALENKRFDKTRREDEEDHRPAAPAPLSSFVQHSTMGLPVPEHSTSSQRDFLLPSDSQRSTPRSGIHDNNNEFHSSDDNGFHSSSKKLGDESVEFFTTGGAKEELPPLPLANFNGTGGSFFNSSKGGGDEEDLVVRPPDVLRSVGEDFFEEGSSSGPEDSEELVHQQQFLDESSGPPAQEGGGPPLLTMDEDEESGRVLATSMVEDEDVTIPPHIIQHDPFEFPPAQVFHHIVSLKTRSIVYTDKLPLNWGGPAPRGEEAGGKSSSVRRRPRHQPRRMQYGASAYNYVDDNGDLHLYPSLFELPLHSQSFLHLCYEMGGNAGEKRHHAESPEPRDRSGAVAGGTSRGFSSTARGGGEEDIINAVTKEGSSDHDQLNKHHVLYISGAKDLILVQRRNVLDDALFMLKETGRAEQAIELLCDESHPRLVLVLKNAIRMLLDGSIDRLQGSDNDNLESAGVAGYEQFDRDVAVYSRGRIYSSSTLGGGYNGASTRSRVKVLSGPSRAVSLVQKCASNLDAESWQEIVMIFDEFKCMHHIASDIPTGLLDRFLYDLILQRLVVEHPKKYAENIIKNSAVGMMKIFYDLLQRVLYYNVCTTCCFFIFYRTL